MMQKQKLLKQFYFLSNIHKFLMNLLDQEQDYSFMDLQVNLNCLFFIKLNLRNWQNFISESSC